MGLIKAFFGAAGGTLADQWKEFFYCEAMDADTLVTKGKKRISARGRSSNTRGEENIISNGSGIAVADGQCMIIVEQGKVVELCAETGEFTYDSSTEPSIFTGSLGKGILDTFKTIGKRFTYGGDTGKDQRIYYFNIKEIMDNKFGTPNPIPFRIVDRNIHLDMDLDVRCSGIYSYKITDPLLFYTNVCGNVASDYQRESIDPQLKTEFVSALQPAFAEISKEQIRPNELPAHTEELSDLMNQKLSEKWGKLRGLTIISIALNPITLTDEDRRVLKEAQRAGVNRDPLMAAGTLSQAQADAMRSAAANEGGAAVGFMGMGLAANAGGANAQAMFQQGMQQAEMQKQAAAAADGWKCVCGAVNTGKFCTECGKPKPEAWTCECGAANTGKFCTECGKPRPVSNTWKCSCGAENKGKFCTECGAPRP